MFKIVLFLFFFLPTTLLATECQPYIGEKLKYSVGWEFIDAGTASMQVQKTATGYRVVNEVKSAGMFSMFKKVHDEIVSEGICLKGSMQSTLFKVNQLEHTYKSFKTTVFDWKHNKVHYTQGGKTDDYDVPAGYLNVLDAFFLLRSMPLKVGHVLHIPIFDARKMYDIEIHVLGKEDIIMKNGRKRTCLVIEPKLKSEAIFSSIGTMKIWLSDDAYHIPLKMSAKIRFGSIIARLIQYKKSNIQTSK